MSYSLFKDFIIKGTYKVLSILLLVVFKALHELRLTT